MAVTIQAVLPGSPAAQAGLAGGMELLAIDGHTINDGLDYEFYSAAANPVLTITQGGGEKCDIPVPKPEYEQLGCEFESYLIDRQHTCRNKCVFCFVDQMPKGMRPSLYFKDDDERMSFLFGNYITLTNLTDAEVRRIIAMRISPVNISVHTANPALRVEMMKNKHAGEVLRYLPMLAEAGIALNTQLVLVPGTNDGDELRRSIEWLAELRPSIQSIAAVPVGLTKFREGLYPIEPYTREQAAAQLDIMLEYGDRFAREDGLRLVYPSDEWFLLAGREVPGEEFYDGYPQLENGVGMWRLLHDEFTEALDELEKSPGERHADIVVGTLAASLFQTLAAKLNDKFPDLHLHVHPIKNDFFGHTITVTGLVTGGDIIRQMQGNLHSGALLLPEVMLRAERDLLLDDVSPEDIAEALGVGVAVIPEGGQNILDALLEDGTPAGTPPGAL